MISDPVTLTALAWARVAAHQGHENGGDATGQGDQGVVEEPRGQQQAQQAGLHPTLQADAASQRDVLYGHCRSGKAVAQVVRSNVQDSHLHVHTGWTAFTTVFGLGAAGTPPILSSHCSMGNT